MSVFNIPPVQLTDSTRQFIIPPTIMSDYHNWLYQTDVPHHNYDFEMMRSWYDQFDEDYTPKIIRAENYPINWKSKMGNTDMNKNFATEYGDWILRKGDMAIREDGVIFMINWDIETYINAQTTQAIICNNRIDIKRHVDAVTDRRGFKVQDAHDEIIVDDLPCVIAEYQGRPDYEIAQNTPGVTSNMLTTVSVQFNEKTKNIRLDDTFEWMCFTYRVINMSYTQVSIDRTYGIIDLHVKRVAGGDKQ